MSALLDELNGAVVAGDMEKAVRLTEQALSEGESPTYIINYGLVPAMKTVGDLFSCHEFFVPEMLMSARAMKAALALLRPRLAQTSNTTAGVVVIGTVKDDLHDIGKNLVANLLEGAGFQVIDLGINVPSQRFVEEARAADARIIALSCLLTTTMMGIPRTIKAIEDAGLRGKVKILVGGPPVTNEFAMSVRADGYAPDAASAVVKAKELLGIT